MTGFSISRDSPRLLHARSEHGYTDNPNRALPEEPEAVSPAYQRYLTRQASRNEASRRRETWNESRSIIGRELAVLTAALGVEVASDLRAIERGLDRIDRRLA